jgi:hypothetical protein
MKPIYLGLPFLVITFLMTSCSVEIKPLDGIHGKTSASDTSDQSKADTADEERSSANEQSDGAEAAAEKKCSSGDATSDIMCDVENM